MSESCPICKQIAACHGGYDMVSGTVAIQCDRCGTFKILETAIEDGLIDDEQSYKISAYTRSSQPGVLTEDLISSIQSAPELTVRQKANVLLAHIARETHFFGQNITYAFDRDYPVASCRNSAEFLSLAKMMEGQKLLEIMAFTTTGVYTSITVNGLDHLEELQKSKPSADTAFVAMSFAEELEDIYHSHIGPAIHDSGYTPVRIDLVPHNGDIISRVLTEIRLAKFVVADFTGHRNGVYFEAGFAKALGLEVVWMCREDELEKAHFDTSHFNHLTWKDDGMLRQRLKARILATIKPGPKYKPES